MDVPKLVLEWFLTGCGYYYYGVGYNHDSCPYHGGTGGREVRGGGTKDMHTSPNQGSVPPFPEPCRACQYCLPVHMMFDNVEGFV